MKIHARLSSNSHLPDAHRCIAGQSGAVLALLKDDGCIWEDEVLYLWQSLPDIESGDKTDNRSTLLDWGQGRVHFELKITSQQSGQP